MKIYGQTCLVKSNMCSPVVKFKELSSYYKLLFMLGDYGFSVEMGKEQGHYGFHSFPVVDLFCLFI